MKVATFDAVLKSLKKLDPWLRSLGIEPKGDHWHQAVQMVERAKEQREIVERGAPRVHIGNYMDESFQGLGNSRNRRGLQRRFIASPQGEADARVVWPDLAIR